MIRISSLVILALAFGAGVCPAQDTVWTRSLGITSTTQAASVQCQGTDVYVGGSVVDGADVKAFAARYSGAGVNQWIRTVALDSNVYGGIVAVGPDQFPYLGMLMGGRTAVLARLNASGDTLWTTKKADVLPSTMVADLSNNCYLLATVGAGIPPKDSLWLGQYNTSGSQTLSKALSLGTIHTSGGLCRTAGGELIAAARVVDSVGSHATLVKFASNGDTLWTRQYSESLATSFSAVAAGDSNTCYATALGGALSRLVRFDPDGDTLWTRSLSLAGLASSLAADVQGNCYLAYSGPDSDFYMDIYDRTGQLLGTRHSGTQGIDTPADLSVGSDGNPVVTGTATDTSTDYQTRTFIVKFLGAQSMITEPIPGQPQAPWRLLDTVSDGTRLDWQMYVPGERRFFVFDAAGRSVLKQVVKVTAGRYSLVLPELGAGSYVVQVVADGTTYKHKFVVQK